jgi:ABC-type nitrate/sulfonate/bicarbonate transport system substrate-binding protein
MSYLIAIVVIFVLQTAAQAADRIRIGMPNDAGQFTLPLAQKRGYLRDEGFDAEIITITGPVANVALANGDIDYFTGFGSAIRAMVQGQLPTRIVACFRPVAHFVLVTRPEVKTIKDLKGRTIGASPANRYIHSNRDGTIEVLMSTYRLDKEAATALYGSLVKGFNDDGNLPEDGLRRLIDDIKSVTKVDREIAFSEISDTSILREAQRDLGIKAK